MTGSMIGTIFKRELRSYFASPLAYIFIVIFLVMAGGLTFTLGGFYESGQASLRSFFIFHPFLYMVLAPALTMRLWAEERKNGTIELLLTLPITMWQAVLGKFLAAWAFVGIALALTFPMWLTVTYLGNPDHGIIVAGYLGSLLMAGAYIAVGACISASTKNQVIAFICSLVMCIVLTFSGFSLILDFFDWLTGSPTVAELVSSLSFLSRFDSIGKGVLSLADTLFFIITITAWLVAGAIVINLKKAD